MTRVPNKANWGVFASERIFMLATVAAADSASTVRKKYSVSIYTEAEPHAMYAIYKQTHTLCVLQYVYLFCLCCISAPGCAADHAAGDRPGEGGAGALPLLQTAQAPHPGEVQGPGHNRGALRERRRERPTAQPG